MTKVLVTAKLNPDLDGTSCSLAYADLLRQLGDDAEGWVTGQPQPETKYFIAKYNIKIPVRPDKSSGNWDKFILVDASSMKGMPKVVIAERVIESIDHRTGEPEKEFPNAKIQNELIGAAATIVVERFIKAGKKIQTDHARLLYGAIYHNTLNFIATNATQRDKEAAGYLESNFGLGENIILEMFDYATREVEGNVRVALENDAKEFGTGWKIGAYQLIMWGKGIFTQTELIEEGVRDLKIKMEANWSFVNIVDLQTKKSHIFVTGSEGEQVLSKALNVKFENNWSILPALLRKQIMPKIYQELERAR
jgi:inorganic pyrophosphatase/exopolyphosphatase